MRPMNCESCGGEVEFRQHGHIQGYYCKNCDWSVVATSIPAIELDETTYKLSVLDADFHNEEQVRVVSQMSGLNFIGSRSLLQQPEPVVFEGKAPQTLAARNQLLKVGLQSKISPSFVY
jgi:hypothetical protein